MKALRTNLKNKDLEERLKEDSDSEYAQSFELYKDSFNESNESIKKNIDSCVHSLIPS